MSLYRILPGTLIALCAVLLPAISVAPPSVSAHAHYDHSQPGIGEVLAAAPARVDIYTDQELRKVAGGNTIAVTNAAGRRVEDGAAAVDDQDRRHFSVALAPSLAPGRYVVQFTTLSDEDGDSDRGRFAFYIGAPPTAADQRLDQELSGRESAGGGSHAGLVAGIAAGVAALIILGGAGLVLARRRRA